MSPILREKRFNMMFSEDEILMLRFVGDKEGLKSSDTIRRLIRQAFAAMVAPMPIDEAVREYEHRLAGREFDERDFAGRRTVADVERDDTKPTPTKAKKR